MQCIIVGAGPAGMIAALRLSRDGHAVTLVGPSASPDDSRTTALMAPSLAALADFGVDVAIESDSAALRTMRIIDGTTRLVRAPTVSFESSEIGEDAFGRNIPNAVLNRALADAVSRSGISRIEAVAEHIDAVREGERPGVTMAGVRHDADVVIGADGARSACREAAGIESKVRDLPQSALVLVFNHRLPHRDISTEFHTDDGPCVQVPLPGDRSSLVWVMKPAEAERLAALPNAELSSAVETRLSSLLGAVDIDESVPRQVYRLNTVLPSAFAKNGIALIGEAAHRFPPIGAQGLNLTIRDVRDLASALSTRTDARAALQRYDSLRRADVAARFFSVNALNRTLLSQFVPLQMARAAGLAALGRSSLLRGFFMREGMSPGAGFSALSPLKGRDRVEQARS